MASIALASVTGNGDSPLSPQIQAAQWLLGMSGNFDGATVELFVNYGRAAEVPIGISYTAPDSDILWLPRCTAFVRVTGAGPNTDVQVAVGELSSEFHRFN